MEQNKPQEIPIEISEETAEGTYVNGTLISFNQQEFIFDFLRTMSFGNGLKSKIKTRIIVTPEHAKRILNVLHTIVANYESQFGATTSLENQLISGFGGPKAQA